MFMQKSEDPKEEKVATCRFIAVYACGSEMRSHLPPRRPGGGGPPAGRGTLAAADLQQATGPADTEPAPTGDAADAGRDGRQLEHGSSFGPEAQPSLGVPEIPFFLPRSLGPGTHGETVNEQIRKRLEEHRCGLLTPKHALTSLPNLDYGKLKITLVSKSLNKKSHVCLLDLCSPSP